MTSTIKRRIPGKNSLRIPTTTQLVAHDHTVWTAALFQWCLPTGVSQVSEEGHLLGA